MRAVVLQGDRAVSVETVADPVLPGPDAAIVKIERTAICGSDLHLYHGAMGLAGVRLGHEFIGTVEEVGDDVRRLRPGDRVLVSGVIGCGRCVACLARDPVMCRVGPSVFGTSGVLPGGQAEAAAVPGADAFALPIPEGVTTAQAVLLTDILPTGYLGACRADIKPGSTVVVIGLGPVGVFALQCAQLFGPARILAVDKVADRLARAALLGAEPIDAGDADPSARSWS
jgi:alcohol dehydrogenase